MLMQLSGMLKEAPEFNLVATYQSGVSALGKGGMFRPNLFLVDMKQPRILELISRFAFIFPNAHILGTMSQWDADLADSALAAGVHGCLLKPFSPADITGMLALYEQRGTTRPSRVMAFFSPKGRSGRSTLASILAVELAKESGESVAIIDADLQFGDLPMFFDVAPKHTIVEAVQDIHLLTPDTLLPYFHPIHEKVWLLGSPTRPEYAELVEADGLIQVIRMAGQLFRYVLVDLPAGFNPTSIAVCEQADTNFLVTMINAGQELQHMKRALRMFDIWGQYGKKIYTVFTRVSPCNKQEKRLLEQHFGEPITEILPNEYQLSSITASGRLLKDLPDDTPFIQSVTRMADDIVHGKR